MSTGNVNLDILLSKIIESAISGSDEALKEIQHRYPSLSDSEVREIYMLISEKRNITEDSTALVLTAPPYFAIKEKNTKVTVQQMIANAKKSILITGYSLSEYFNDLLDQIIEKSKTGVFVKFFVNDIDNQSNFEKLCRYKGNFLKIYNYTKPEDKMSALHAKVISVDQEKTLITSANLSYHGQEGNIELGTYTISTALAKQVNDVFTSLIFHRIFSEIQ